MEKKNLEYLRLLRETMKSHGIDAVVVSGTDPHQSELPPAHWRGREWLTGFWSENGTNGTAVVTADKGSLLDRLPLFHTGYRPTQRHRILHDERERT